MEKDNFDKIENHLVAKSLHTAPFDWDALGDSLTLLAFEKSGQKILAPSPSFAYTFFDKYEAYHALIENHIPTPPTTLVNRALLLADSGATGITRNVYREYLLEKLFSHPFPVVIKDRIGVSSFHIEVARCFGDAKSYILGKRNKVDKVLQPLLVGSHICVEVFSTGDFFFTGAPFLMSLNQYGVTSPRFNQKVSANLPQAAKKALDALLAQFMKAFCPKGVIQFDLVLDALGSWWVIEVNPRIGGVTNCSCAAFGATLDEVFSSLLQKKPLTPTHYALEVKLPVTNASGASSIKAAFPRALNGKRLTLFALTQEENKNATQLRERGFCAVTLQSPAPVDPSDAKALENFLKELLGH